MMFAPQREFRCGVEECSKPALAARTNIAMATLPNFTLPGDVSASKRYWKRDIIVPEVETTADGTIVIRDEPGFGYEIDQDFLLSVIEMQESVS